MALTFLRWHSYLALYSSENWPFNQKKKMFIMKLLILSLVIILYSAFSSSVNASKIHPGTKAILWKSAFFPPSPHFYYISKSYQFYVQNGSQKQTLLPIFYPPFYSWTVTFPSSALTFCPFSHSLYFS